MLIEAVMAFVSTTSSTRLLKRPRSSATSPCRIGVPKWRAQSDPQPQNLPQQPSFDPSSPVAPTSTPSIPPSLAASCELAVKATKAALETNNKIFIEIDTTSGDATYTMLKTSIPIARMLDPELPTKQVLLPDAGAAAYAGRDWPDANILGLEEAEPGASIIVTPRASEVSALVRLAETDEPIVILNPDLVDMGVTGLSLNARRLRESLIDKFTTAYYLKVFEWGVLQRAFPGKWGVWIDDPGSEIGFKLVKECDERPAGDALDEILSEALGSGEGLFVKFRRFLSVYMKG